MQIKKNLFVIFFCFITSSIFSQEQFQEIQNDFKYQISNVNYEVKSSSLSFLGKTKPYAINLNEPIDKKRIFQSKEELNLYLKDYELRLNNLRAFDTIIISQSLSLPEDSQTVVPVTVNIKVKDSIHIIALPYPSYNSNDGFKFKLKAKDSNFLGSLNMMNISLDFQKRAKDDENDLDEITLFGFGFDFDYPFKAGFFDMTWCNDYSFSYTLGNESPEWNLETGLKLSKEFSRLSLILGFYQTFDRDFDYNYSDNSDLTYFGEEIKFETPIELINTQKFGKLKYTPYVDFVYNWDYLGKNNSNNGINIKNSSLSSPYLTFGQSLSFGRVNWKDNLRNGLNINFSNYFKFNFQRKVTYPEISLDVKTYKYFNLLPTDNFFNKAGIASRLFTFVDIFDYNNKYFQDDGTNIGSYLRGIIDNQSFETSDKYSSWYALKTPSAIILSLDFPIHIFETHIDTKFLRTFNFDLQISPFVDLALTYNKYTKKWFSPKDGLYAGGVEFLVHPASFRSFIVRGSLGFDLGRLFFSESLDNSWRKNCKKYEISIGLGLQY